MADPHRVAIIFPYYAHYREPVLRALVSQAPPLPRYTLFADRVVTDGESNLKLINWEANVQPVEAGGLGLRRLRNRTVLVNPLLWQHGALRVAASRDFDVLIFMGSMWHLSTWLAAALARLRGKRVLFWGHGYVRDERNLKGWVRKQFYRLFHGALLFGNRARQLMMERRFKPERLHVVFNSLDQPTQCEQRRHLDASTREAIRRELFPHAPDGPLLIAVGRLMHRKRCDLLIEAAAMLHRQGRAVNVLLVGGGPEEPGLRELADRLELDEHVRLLGPCYEESRLARMIHAADLCVVPGWIGLTAMHALAYGTPVITHGNPANHAPEYEAVIPGYTGAFFKEGDTQALADAIRRWLDNRVPTEQIRRNCHHVVDTYYNPAYQCRVINRAVRGEPAESVDPRATLDPSLADPLPRDH